MNTDHALRTAAGFLGRTSITSPMRVVGPAFAGTYDDAETAAKAAEQHRAQFPDVVVVPAPRWNPTTKSYDNA